MTTHLMVDIETLGTRQGAVVISAAFVRCSDEAHMVLNLNIAVPPPHIALNDALGQSRALMASLAILARAHGHRAISDRRATAELAIANGECAAQLEIKDATLRGTLIDNIAAAFTC